MTIEERTLPQENVLATWRLLYAPGVDNGWDSVLPPFGPDDWNVPPGRLIKCRGRPRSGGGISYTHDHVGRLVASVLDSGDYLLSQHWMFDEDGLLVHYDESMDLSWDPDTPPRTRTEDRSYDDQGRLAHTEWSRDGAPYSVGAKAYDGTVTTATVDYVQWPGTVDEAWRWEEDASGRVGTWGVVSEVNGSEVHHLTHDERDRVVEDTSFKFFLWPTWWCERWTYDDEDRPVRIEANNYCGGEEEGYFVYDYAYDERGNQTLWEWKTNLGYPFERWTWTYDDEGRRTERLVEETSAIETSGRYYQVQRDTWTYETGLPCGEETADEAGRRHAPPKETLTSPTVLFPVSPSGRHGGMYPNTPSARGPRSRIGAPAVEVSPWGQN